MTAAQIAPQRSRVSFEVTGAPDGKPVAVLGGISSSRHVASNDVDSTPGWWEECVGPGCAIDPDEYRLIGIDYADRGDSPKAATTFDQAERLAVALDEAGIDHLHAIVGASYGGMVALAFAAAYAHRVGRLVVIAAAHRPDAIAVALRLVQRRIVELGRSVGRAREGIELARALAVIGYSTPRDFEDRFAPDDPVELIGRVGEYLGQSGASFASRFDADRFVALSRSLDAHRVIPEDIRTPTALIATRSDALVSMDTVRELAARLGGPCRLIEVESSAGHDAFLNDLNSVGPLITQALSAEIYP